ncbi:hypothetical protein [Mycobacterium sp. M26]|uniref:hypothetical protein n=1 Tax=Mycobacterium sp. M26 TaxID=1762962 RepID=UPI00073F420B|nr:hypothetical protein [Mycobacterium sp. M26]
MTVSVRSYLTAGMATVVASALTIAPMQVVAPETVSATSLRLSAAVQPLVQPVTTAAAALGLVSEAPKPAAAASAAATPQASVTANSTAGDWVISSWNFINYWVGYAADLAQYALGWVWPLSLIGDQFPLLWNNLGVPIGNALVYGLIVPVLNDPLNLAVWGTGINIVVQSTVAAVVNTVLAEIDYFIGWILPPLPPLPFPPLPGAAVAAAPLAAAVAGDGSADAPAEDAAPAETPKATGHSARTKAVKDTPSVAALSAQVVDSTTTAVDTPDATPDTPKTGDNSSDNGGTKSGGSAKKSGSTGGSARAHKAKSGD